MKMLLSKGKLPELKSINLDMCESCILGKQKRVSYGDEKFGYRFWDEQNQKIIRSRNVIFNE